MARRLLSGTGMFPRRGLRVPRWLSSFLWLVAAGCLQGDTASYTPQRDDRAMLAIASTWAEPGAGGASLFLCEDVTAVPDDNTCQVEHVVRGGGRGIAHEQEHGGGCGGCPFANVAYVHGSLDAAGLPGPVEVTGEVTLAPGAGADTAYDFPYSVMLRCSDPAAPCTIYGTLEADGRLELELPNALTNTAGSTGTTHLLTRTGAATCPPAAPAS